MTDKFKKLQELKLMLRDKLITEEEFNILKQELFTKESIENEAENLKGNQVVSEELFFEQNADKSVVGSGSSKESSNQENIIPEALNHPSVIPESKAREGEIKHPKFSSNKNKIFVPIRNKLDNLFLKFTDFVEKSKNKKGLIGKIVRFCTC